MQQGPLSAPAYVVLGMILLGRRSGYEIKQTVELSIRFFWTISPAQIYPALEALERAGLVRGKEEPRGKLRRRSFEVTPTGKAAFEAWLAESEALPFELRDIAMVKLFFADLLDRPTARQLVETIASRSMAHIAQLNAVRGAAHSFAADKGFSFPAVTLRLGIAYHHAIVEECRTIKRELHTRPKRKRRNA